MHSATNGSEHPTCPTGQAKTLLQHEAGLVQIHILAVDHEMTGRKGYSFDSREEMLI